MDRNYPQGTNPFKEKYIPWAAPLAGISDSPFRVICKQFGAQVLFSEMISTEGLVRKQKNTLKMLKILDGDGPVATQLFGKRPEAFADCVRYLDDNCSYVSMYNLNAGCPVKKVVRNGCGVCLMNDPVLIGKIVSAMKNATQKPVSVKIRAGTSDNDINALECANAAQSEGADFVIIHGRTAKQMFSGQADRGIIKQLKDNLKIPVVGNGDIQSALDVRDMLEQTGCDAVMVGRASIGNPWIFLKDGEARPKSRQDVCETALRHLELCQDFYGPVKGCGMIKRHMIQYAAKSGFSAASERKIYNDKICNATKLDEQREAIRVWASL